MSDEFEQSVRDLHERVTLTVSTEPLGGGRIIWLATRIREDFIDGVRMQQLMGTAKTVNQAFRDAANGKGKLVDAEIEQ